LEISRNVADVISSNRQGAAKSLQCDVTLRCCIFIARQHTDALYWYSKSVCLSVRPSVTFRYCM